MKVRAAIWINDVTSVRLRTLLPRCCLRPTASVFQVRVHPRAAKLAASSRGEETDEREYVPSCGSAMWFIYAFVSAFVD